MLVTGEPFFSLGILWNFCMLYIGEGYRECWLISNRAAGSRQQELAIFVRHIDIQSQFYTMSGRWVHRSDKHPLFYVPNFVEGHEVEAIKEFLPQQAVPMELEDRLHSFEIVPPRNV